MALVFISVIIQDLAVLFVDNGMGSYIVQSQNLSHREYSSLFYQVLILASGFMLGLSAVAPWLAAFFKSPALVDALQIIAFSFFLIALPFPQKGILQRHMHFKRIAVTESVGMLLAAIVTIYIAYQGFGFKSYLYGFLVRRFAEAAVLWQKEFWLPKPLQLVQPFQALFRYSVYASNALILSYAVRLVNTFIVGRMLGVHILDLYSLASNIIFIPVSKCVYIFSRVFLVNVSLAKHETFQLHHTYAEAMKLCLLLLPALCVLAITIPEIMQVFFKPAWLPVADLVRVITIYGAIIVFLRMGEAVLLALAKVRTSYYFYSSDRYSTGLAD
jgi:O-antigen/teichoic acid export membrane protein